MCYNYFARKVYQVYKRVWHLKNFLMATQDDDIKDALVYHDHLLFNVPEYY